MDNLEMLERIKYSIENRGVTYEKCADMISLIMAGDSDGTMSSDEVVRWARYARSKLLRIRTDEAYGQIYECYRIAGAYNFDDYMSACEFYRDPAARFWWPRRRVLEGKHRIASQIQEFIDSKEARYLGFSMPPGTGKLLADDTPVLTHQGWKKHGDLVVGDEVIGMDGKYKKVRNVFPKDVANVRVWFSNGEHIDCHENHEWLVHDRARGEEVIVEARKFLQVKLDSGIPDTRGHRYRFMLPAHEPVRGNDIHVPVRPYMFGAWLGDGTSANPYLTLAEEDLIIAEKAANCGYSIRHKWIHKTTGVYTVDFWGLREDLEMMGLCNSRHPGVKYIPDEYFLLTERERLELLAGLIDTDGTKCDGSKYAISTVIPELRDGIIKLLSTFGWRACMTEEQPHMSSGGIEGKRTCWRIQFTPDRWIPLYVERKKQTSISKQRRISIVKAERIDPVPGNCIQVEDGMYLVGNTMIPTHNSTLIKFLLAYVAGRWPDSANMYVSYSDGMVKMLLDSEKAILTDKSEYKHNEIFHNGRPAISSEYKTLSYRMKGDFPTLGLVALGGSVTGRTRANKFLITDDLVKNAEEARSPERLEKLYADYKATLTTRMIGDDVKQIQLGTIWSVHDPISRMKAEHEGDPRYRFIAIPVCDEEGHSNFLYDHPDNYTDEKIREIREEMDPVDFSCLYMQQGIQKEGLAFRPDEMRYYNGVLPPVEPDKRTFFCDVAFGGGDSLAQVFAYVYQDDIFIPDVVFNKGAKDETQPVVVGRIMRHRCHTGRFEANNGGDFYADDIDQALRGEGYHMNITTAKAPTTMSKEARIEQYAPDIKRFVFLEPSMQSEEYKRFMTEVFSFSFTAKNIHDDAPDALAGLAAMLVEKPKVVTSPFKRW